MGWNAGEHEGWVANVLDDGRVAVSSTGGGVVVREVTPGDLEAGYEVRRWDGHDEVVVPWERVATWRLTCECGWIGSERPAITDPSRPLSGHKDCNDVLEIEEEFGREWYAHAAPYAALAALDELTDQAAALEETITATVHTARCAGASWSEIGRATGRSKQAAQQRWGN